MTCLLSLMLQHKQAHVVFLVWELVTRFITKSGRQLQMYIAELGSTVHYRLPVYK